MTSSSIPAADVLATPLPSHRVGLAAATTVTVFMCSWLLFSLEPMASKLLLPRLGGSPTVWITCLMFFQAALLAGYGYAHVSIRLLGIRRQAVLQVALIVASLLFLPVSLESAGAAAAYATPVRSVLFLLTSSIGIPFIVLASIGPIAQRWLSDSLGEGDPYFLYAASNLGSLLALLSYPLLVEPRLTLTDQKLGWSLLYAGVVLGVSAIAWNVSRFEVVAHHDEQAVVGAPVTARDRLRWLLYAAVPSSLLMGVTSFISTDLGAFPLLWVIPLALYLLTYSLVFARRPPLAHSVMLRIEPHVIVVAACSLFWSIALRGMPFVVLHLALLFVIGMVCHGELVRSRPHASHLTEFYLWLAVGGLCGGIFNALIAPALFEDVYEYALAITIAAALRPGVGRAGKRMDFIAPVVFAGVLFAVTWKFGEPPDVVPTIVTFGAAIILFSFRESPRRFSLALGLMFAAGMTRTAFSPVGRPILETERSFFGVYRVVQDSSGTVRMLENATTVHGVQALDSSARMEPLSYYNRRGPAGDVFSKTAAASLPARRIAVVGLGVGSLACYGRQDEAMVFYEIDPLVASLATDTRHFTLLRDCPARSTIVLGDARLTLARAKAASLDILVIDAFSSDAIPVHLLTREAIEEYLRVLAAEGVLAIHISNEYMDLEPLLSGVSADMGLVARVRRDLSPERNERLSFAHAPSLWVVVTRDASALGGIGGDSTWVALRRTPAVKAWTDDFSNILSVIKWR